MKTERIPIYILLMFTAVYMLFAKDTRVWNGLYFVANYSILSLLFYEVKDKWVKTLGCALSLSILIFNVLKFFFLVDQEKLTISNIITFIIIAFAIYKLETK